MASTSAVPAPADGPDAGAVWHYGDPLGEQRAAAERAVVVDRSHRAVLSLTGAERKSWLHTISSQHVSDLADGVVVENLSLDGQGRVEDQNAVLGGAGYGRGHCSSPYRRELPLRSRLFLLFQNP